MPHTTLIDAPGLARLVGRPGVAIVDCRFDLAAVAAGRQAWLDGHIPGAVHADLNRDLSDPPGAASGRHPLPDREAFAARVGAMGIDNDTQVIAYDQAGGAMAARLWWMMRWLGHRAVAVLDGGYAAWAAHGGAVQAGAGAAAAAPRRFLPGSGTLATASSEQVHAAVLRHDRLIVDARAAERYAGETEPLDTVAGHVPGARNVPFTGNLTAAQRFLPAPQLRQRWSAVLGGAEPADVIAMCGSGVTACHNLLALEIAGFPGAALYAGSWSEWIRDPARPVATGREP